MRNIARYVDSKQRQEDKLQAIFFDRKDIETLSAVEEDGVYRNRKVKQEHIVLVGEPGGRYIGHVTPPGKAADPIAAEILDFLDEENLTTNWVVAGADSTAVNTRKDRGIIVRCEKSIGHRLHWDICLLHTNELPLRHLFQKLDGPTSGSSSFRGTLGKMLQHVEELEWNDTFHPIIEGPELRPLPQVTSDLSTDQRYLLLSVMSIRNGKIYDTLRHLKAFEGI